VISAPPTRRSPSTCNNKDTATPHDVVIKDANGAEKFEA
jgi:hypothetical protein